MPNRYRTLVAGLACPAAGQHDTPSAWIILRGVSDFGDVAKSNTFQVLAAKVACLALRELLTNYIDINQIPENIRAREFEASFEFNIIQQNK